MGSILSSGTSDRTPGDGSSSVRQPASSIGEERSHDEDSLVAGGVVHLIALYVPGPAEPQLGRFSGREFVFLGILQTRWFVNA